MAIAITRCYQKNTELQGLPLLFQRETINLRKGLTLALYLSKGSGLLLIIL